MVKYTKPHEPSPQLKKVFDERNPEAAEAMLALLIKLAKENPPGVEIPIPPPVQQDIDEVIKSERTAFECKWPGTIVQ